MNSTPRNVPHDNPVTIINGDCIRVMRMMDAESIDAVICDPPYAVRAIGDVLADFRLSPGHDVEAGCRLCPAMAAPGYRVCRDCSDLIETNAFAAADMLGQQSSNWHEAATHSRGYADNDPQEFGRWCRLWANECKRVLKPGGHLIAFGGTRTWHRVATAAEDAGFVIRDSLAWLYATGVPKSLNVQEAVAKATASKTTTRGDQSSADEDVTWAGWGTNLKPAHEPIVLARKPLVGTVAENVLRYGIGALDIDGARLGARWPTNVFLDEQQGRELEAATGQRTRFFWVAKPGPSERVRVDGISHPTVKPIALMRELIRLVTSPGDVVLDPFAGSGSTAEACVLEDRRCVAIERDPDYLLLIEKRLQRQSRPGTGFGSADERGEQSPLLLF